MAANDSSKDLIQIKKKLKDEFNFIKNDGTILNLISRELLHENKNNLDKTLEFIDTLSKNNIQKRMYKIMNDLATAGEITQLTQELCKKDTQQYEQIKQSLNDIQTKYTNLEQSNKQLEHNLDSKQKDIYLLENIITQNKQQLTDIQTTLDNIFQNGYENEYEYLECDYIVKDPVIHLDCEKALKSIHGITKELLYFKSDAYGDLNSKCSQHYRNIFYQDKTIECNFPINYTFDDKEYIVKIYLIQQNQYTHKRPSLRYTGYTHNCQNSMRHYDHDNGEIYNKNEHIYSLIYVTNYGRFINSENMYLDRISYILHGQTHENIHTGIIYPIKTYLDNKYYIISNSVQNGRDYYYNNCYFTLDYTIEDIKPEILPKLTYRMPRLFLDVIDAFHTQNNDLMQECCKKYLTISRTKGNDNELIDNIEFEKQLLEKEHIITDQKNIIHEKDDIIYEKDQIIEKMQNEIAKLKSALAVFTQ